MLEFLVHFNVPSQSNVMTLLRILVKKCHGKTLLGSIWMSVAKLSSQLQSSPHFRRAAAGQSIMISSPMKIMHPASLPKPISSRMISTSTSQLKQNCTAGQPAAHSDMVQSQLNTLSQAYSELAQQSLKLSSEISTLRAYCAVMGAEIHNAKENRPQKWHKLNIDTRWLNSDKGLRLVVEHEALWAAEEQKKSRAREQ